MNVPLVFLVTLSLTGILLFAVVITGQRAQRKLHIPLVALTLASLTVTIVFAKKLGELYDIHSAGWITPLHLGIAKATAVAFLLPLITGIGTLRKPTWRPWHRRMAFLVIGLTLASIGTGAWMILVSPAL